MIFSCKKWNWNNTNLWSKDQEQSTMLQSPQIEYEFIKHWQPLSVWFQVGNDVNAYSTGSSIKTHAYLILQSVCVGAQNRWTGTHIRLQDCIDITAWLPTWNCTDYMNGLCFIYLSWTNRKELLRISHNASGLEANIQDLWKEFKSPRGGGGSNWHGICICACLLGHFFAKFGIVMGGFIRDEGAPIT